MSYRALGFASIVLFCAAGTAACGGDAGPDGSKPDDGVGGAGAGSHEGAGGSGTVDPLNATRFSEGAKSWSLPPGFEHDKMDDLAEKHNFTCGPSGDFSAATLDMTADGIPDLVVTDNCDDEGVGSTEWLVFEGSADGFAAGPIIWSLPPGFEHDKMDDLAEKHNFTCGPSGDFSAATLDMTADGIPDLVVTDNCDDEGVGSNEWLVFEGSASGFAAGPITWSLPPGFEHDKMDDLAERHNFTCGPSGDFSAATLDMTADGIPDLVVTDNCDDEGVGSNEWLVFEGSASGFAAGPIMWSLPPGFEHDKMDDLAERHNFTCGPSGDFSAATLDMTADGIPDLVVTDNCDDEGVGSNEWLVFEGSASGFAAGPITWSLPPGFEHDKMDDLAEKHNFTCGPSGDFSAVTMDLSGDGIVDLVVTDNCDDAGVGSSEWLLFEGSASGFAAGPIMWSLPPGFEHDKMDDLAERHNFTCGPSGDFSAVTADMTGDGVADLVVTDNCDDEGVGSSAWLVFPAIE